MPDFPLKNWIPYRLENKEDQLQCLWLNTHNEPFAEPFFDDTILKFRSLDPDHISIKSVSDLAMFKNWAANLNDVEPSAIIFHISRCGSTLVSQMLSTSNEHIVLPEVPFFDDLLRLPYQHDNFTESTASRLLVNAIKYYGQKRTGYEQRLYIKADSWHIFFYEQLRQLYPTVPFILMYRKPNEVFNSHKKIPGIQSVPGLIEPAIFNFKPGEEVPLNLDLYISIVLERYLIRYHEIADTDKKFLLINYDEGPMPIIHKIAAFTNTPVNNEFLAAMEERSRYHSKNANEVFSEIKPVNIPSCLDKAMGLYYSLEKKRIAIEM